MNAIDSTRIDEERTFECTSLCRVSTGFDGQRWLYRLADIAYGELMPFSLNKSQPRVFENRDQLFWNDGPNAENVIGIWRWNARPRDTDVAKDYITSAFAEDLQPIEMLGLADVNSRDELISALTAGADVKPAGTRAFFCPKEQLYGNSSQIECIYCTIDDISFVNRRAALKSGTARISVATIVRENIQNIQGTFFYRYITVKEPFQSVPVLNPDTVIRQAIMGRFTWPVAKGFGITRSDWKLVKDFITEVPEDEIWKEVAETCQCDEAEAKQYFAKFVERAETYIDREDFDDRLLLDLISNHRGLQEKCNLLVEQQWKETHKKEIDAASEALRSLQKSAKSEQDSVELKKKEQKVLEDKLIKLSEQIEEKERLAEEVTQRVSEQIETAKRDTSAYLAKLITLNPSVGFAPISNVQDAHDFACFEDGIELANENPEVNKDGEGVIETLHFELFEAGVVEKYAFELAAFLYAAFSCHLPVLLAGPNGDSIADALSVSIYGRTADRMNCWGSCNQESIMQIGRHDNKILTIKNAFQGTWVMHLPEMLDTKTYCVVVHPYADDLAVEPREIYNYFLPILTESLTDSVPSRAFVGGRMDDDFKHLSPQKILPVYDKLFRKLRMPTLLRKNLQRVLAYYRMFIGQERGELESLFSAVPYAYLTNQVNQDIFDDICSDMSVGSEMKGEISLILGESDG